MSDGGSLIEIGKLAEPAKVLIEKVSDAIGGVFRPYQIIRIARAEVEAGIIKAEGQLAITEIQQRGLQRLVYQEGKKQQNIENITMKAIPMLEEKSNPREIDDDWLANFFDKCGLVSDEEMQIIWGKLLAGEANKAGSFKKRTINAIANFEKEDAHLFTTLCRFGVGFGNFVPLIFDSNAEIYLKHGINFSKITHLESIGLVSFNNVTGYVRQGLSREFAISYFDEFINIKLKEGENKINIGKVLLTDIGHQLSAICGADKIDDFTAYMKLNWGDRII